MSWYEKQILRTQQTLCSAWYDLPLGMQAMAADGLTTVDSMHGPQDTMERLETEVKAKGLTVFARIDHAAGLRKRGGNCDRPRC